MMVNERLDIDVRNTVAVGQAEGLVTNKLLYSLQSPAGQRVFARVDQGDFPRLRGALVDRHLIVHHIEGDIRGMQKIVCEVFLCNVTFITKADHEVIDSIME